jgi:hypothetical protein
MANDLGSEPVLRFEWNDHDSASAAVIDAIERVSGISALDMRPIYESVDPDALDALLHRATTTGNPRTVSFGYDGYRVTLDSSGGGHVSEWIDR